MHSDGRGQTVAMRPETARQHQYRGPRLFHSIVSFKLKQWPMRRFLSLIRPGRSQA